MAADNLLKAYLVKVGFDIESAKFNKINSDTDKLSAKLKNFVSNFRKVTSATIGVITTVAKATKEMISDVAAAEREVDRLATRMRIGRDTARSYYQALKFGGYNSISDLKFASADEIAEFKSLMSFSKSIAPPEELQGTLKLIREIGLEIKKFKMMISDLRQWVVYYIGKKFGLELEEIRNKVKGFVEWVRDNIPRIASKIADIIARIYYAGKGLLGIVENLLSVLRELSPQSKTYLGITGFFTMLLTPIGRFIAAILALLLLLEDFAVWKSGKGKSAMGEIFGDYSHRESNESFIGLKDIGSNIANIAIGIGKIISDLIEGINWKIVIEIAKEALSIVKDALPTILDILNLILNYVYTVALAFNGFKALLTPNDTLGRRAELAGNALDSLMSATGSKDAEELRKKLGMSGLAFKAFTASLIDKDKYLGAYTGAVNTLGIGKNAEVQAFLKQAAEYERGVAAAYSQDIYAYDKFLNLFGRGNTSNDAVSSSIGSGSNMDYHPNYSFDIDIKAPTSGVTTSGITTAVISALRQRDQANPILG